MRIAIGVCLADTERRQGFSYGMSTDQLRIALQRIGTSAVRMYLCRDSDGNAAASRVVLHSARGTAVDWLAGTSDPQLSSGATQLLIKFALEDLGSVGATAFDFAGANLPSVAKAKSHLGRRSRSGLCDPGTWTTGHRARRPRVVAVRAQQAFFVRTA